jgi:predicted nucleotidyltransferase
MTALDELEKRTRSKWDHLHFARRRSHEELQEITATLKSFSTADASIVVVGSLAREEFTTDSDIDWTLLLDGMSHPQDEQLARDIRLALEEINKKQPGREGVFGTLVSSHDLIHRIGGEADTNSNTTRRILLLLESIAIGRPDAHNRVLNNILYRYLEEDRGLWFGSNASKVPRFLFNDVARYWRTMAVDFAYKQRTRPDGGFLIRNTKLRMSRKLLFLAGMLVCFDCHTRFGTQAERRDFYTKKPVEAVIDRLREVLARPPLEVLAQALLPYGLFDESIKQLFTAYDDFVGMLADENLLANGLTKRKHLDVLRVEEIENDPVASEAREISHRFRDSVSELFLTKDTELGRLTLEYGVF